MGRRRGDHNDAPEVPVQVIMLSNGEVRRYQHVDQRRLQDVGTVRSGDQPICWVLLRCACARLGPVRVLGWVLVRSINITSTSTININKLNNKSPINITKMNKHRVGYFFAYYFWADHFWANYSWVDYSCADYFWANYFPAKYFCAS